MSGASILIAAVCASLSLSAGELFLYRAAAGQMWFLHSPFGLSPFLLPSDPSPFPVPMALLLPGLLLLISFLISQFAPTGRELAGQLIAATFVLGLVSMGVAPPLISMFASRATMSAEMPLIAFALAGLGTASLLVLRTERRLILTLGNLFAVETPAHRLRLWAIRLSIPMIALAGFCFLNRYPAAGAGCLGALTLTFFENLARRPRQNYLELARPELREEAATLPIIAAILIAAQLFSFGSPALKLRRRVLVVSNGHVRLERAFWPSGRIIEGTSRIAPPPGQMAPVSKEEQKKRIEIRWSKPHATSGVPVPSRQ